MGKICKIGRVESRGFGFFRRVRRYFLGSRWAVGSGLLTLVFLVACSGPPKRPDRPPIHTRFYRVHKGDTLYSIARRSGRDFKVVARWNDISPPYTIYPGQMLRLIPPAPRKVSRPAPVKKKPVSSPSPKKTEKKLKVRWRWPLKGTIARNFAQTGGKGIDIAASKDRSVQAAASGKVVYSGSGLVGYGNLVIIKHGETYLSAYGNNRRLLVQEGQKVRGGQVIAEVGNAAGNRSVLHFEIRRRGDPVNPLWYLPKR